IQVDERHWRRVLENLLYHALAASPSAGSVRIVVHEEAGDWCLEVYDHGECLSETMRLQMFEPFGIHRGGTGLGLATVWQICEADGWALTVESEQTMTCIRVQARMGDEVQHG
ncbi:MAG: ATP-binding protein, partial [Mariprofundaceae bacterium]|nr:ATP-binding protein [Mariprofundaceae bacterium]